MSEAGAGDGTNSGGGLVRIDQWWLRLGAIAVVLAVVADILYNVNVKKGDNGGTGPMIGVGIILILLAAVLYLMVFPRYADYARAALVTGIISVLLLAVFWSGATLLVAPAAFGYGMRASATPAARVGMGLAALAGLVDLVGAIASAS